MGFNYHGCGNIRTCGIQSGQIVVQDPFGRTKKYPTGLPEEIQPQCNLFWNGDIAFLLYTNDKREIIGRYDGSISIYDGDLLVGMNHWTADQAFALEHIGYAIAGQLHRIMLDVTDRRTIFLEGVRYEALLPETFNYSPDISGAIAAIERQDTRKIIKLVGGGEIEVPVWSVQNDLRIGTCRSIV